MEVYLTQEPNTNGMAFRYSHPLKTLYKKGKLPSVVYGFYGDKLDPKKVSLEHLKPKSKGGKSKLHNYVLASPEQNRARGNDDIRNHFNPAAALQYLLQFVNVNLPGFKGNKYIQMILRTLQSLGVDVSFYTAPKTHLYYNV